MLVCLLLAGTAAGAEDAAPAYDANTVVATVNGKAITLGHMIMLRSKLPPEYQNLPDETLFPGILDQLIDQELLGAEEIAEAGGVPFQVRLAVENEQRTLLASNRINKIASVDISEDQIQAAYLEAYGELQPEQEFHAAHILVETEEEAKDLIKELEGGADFAALAEEHSTDTSAANGGDLGWFGIGMMVKPFEDAVIATAPGTWSPPVQSQFGWHIVKMLETREKPLPTIDEVRAELIAGLQQKILEDKLAELRAAGEIDRPDGAVPISAIRESELVMIPAQ
jgi:peptidyl-prolyl cis-trans isomerase C